MEDIETLTSEQDEYNEDSKPSILRLMIGKHEEIEVS